MDAMVILMQFPPVSHMPGGTRAPEARDPGKILRSPALPQALRTIGGLSPLRSA